MQIVVTALRDEPITIDPRTNEIGGEPIEGDVTTVVEALRGIRLNTTDLARRSDGSIRVTGPAKIVAADGQPVFEVDVIVSGVDNNELFELLDAIDAPPVADLPEV